jgi:hypothetical protein
VQFTIYPIWIFIIDKIFQIDINRKTESDRNQYYPAVAWGNSGVPALRAFIPEQKKSARLHFPVFISPHHDGANSYETGKQALVDGYHDAFLFIFLFPAPALRTTDLVIHQEI